MNEVKKNNPSKSLLRCKFHISSFQVLYTPTSWVNEIFYCNIRLFNFFWKIVSQITLSKQRRFFNIILRQIMICIHVHKI